MGFDCRCVDITEEDTRYTLHKTRDERLRFTASADRISRQPAPVILFPVSKDAHIQRNNPNGTTGTTIEYPRREGTPVWSYFEEVRQGPRHLCHPLNYLRKVCTHITREKADGQEICGTGEVKVRERGVHAEGAAQLPDD